MQYLTINDYLEYGGQLEDEPRYNRHEYRARMFLDMMTLGCIDEVVAQRESIKRCMYELIENYEQEYQQSLVGIGVQSVTNDGVSVTYGTNGGSASIKKRCVEIVDLYLANETYMGLPLLYRGVM